jgi:hypothetical protein
MYQDLRHKHESYVMQAGSSFWGTAYDLDAWSLGLCPSQHQFKQDCGKKELISFITVWF